jgi:hypothetical protein
VQDLIREYNQLVDRARALGLDRVRNRERFATGELAVKYIEQLQSSIRAAQNARRAEDNSGVSVEESEMAIRKRDRLKAEKAKAKAPAKTKAAPEKKVRAKAADGAPTIKQLTEEWNKLVPAANRKGVKGVKVHTSNFGSREHAEARVAWLKEQMAA